VVLSIASVAGFPCNRCQQIAREHSGAAFRACPKAVKRAPVLGEQESCRGSASWPLL
jgi:hypothetical protein